MKRVLFFNIFLLTATLALSAQDSKKVLFLGNSYTAVNNLPLMISTMAVSTGDELIYDSNTPGGYRFMDHASSSVTLDKINAKDWDYVILQAQSQETSLSQAQMQVEVYPFAESLSNAIRANNECSQPMFYMTWGRENGDASNCASLPWVCTYQGMDSAIRATYIYMAETNHAEITPVGAVWREIRTNHPEIELFSGDGSHPSVAGSYAAACAFYAMIYKKAPTTVTWNSTLSEIDAQTIRMVAGSIVFDSLSNWNFTINPAVADFSEVIEAHIVSFTNTSSDFDEVFWDFGDGATSTEIHPVHTYPAGGDYKVSLTITRCGKNDVKTKTISIESGVDAGFLNFNAVSIYPNPASHEVNIKLDRNYKTVLVTLRDFSGKIVHEKSALNSAFFHLNTSGLSIGTYVLTVIADEYFYSTTLSKM